LGRCSLRDYEMIAPGGDSTQLVFRSSWSTALRALRHAVELDSRYGNAYPPLFNILFAETRDGCSSVTWKCEYVSPVVRDGDSVRTVPRFVVLNRPGVDTYDEVIRETRATRRVNLDEARALAERWAAVAPDDRRPHEYLGQALLRLGSPEAATAELERAAKLGTPVSRRALFWDRMEALVRTDRGEEARRCSTRRRLIPHVTRRDCAPSRYPSSMRCSVAIDLRHLIPRHALERCASSSRRASTQFVGHSLHRVTYRLSPSFSRAVTRSAPEEK
jgi:hypothetical protein